MTTRSSPALLLLLAVACGTTPAREVATARDVNRGAACLADVLPDVPRPQDFVWYDHPCGAGGPACTRACEGGDREACLAHAYAIERVGGDSERTRPWYERACRLGSLNGCTNWGAGFRAPPASAPELACAARVFERTCAAREPWGCGMWGTALLVGRGVVADPVRGVAVLRDACAELGHFPCEVLATALEDRDPASAAALRARACATGYREACEAE